MKNRVRLMVMSVIVVVLVVCVVPMLIQLNHLDHEVQSISQLRAHEHSIWILIAILSAGMMLGGYALATMQARQLAKPIVELIDNARLCGGGEEFVPLARTGIAEIDQLAQTFHNSASRMKEAIGRERQYSADVSHQLRTPLASLRLKLDAAGSRCPPEVIQPFLNDLLHMERTIDHLREATRTSGLLSDVVLLDGVTRRAYQRWQPILAQDGRSLVIPEVGSLAAQGSATSFDQILDVLISNAHAHGRGSIVVAIRSLWGGCAIDVADEGDGLIAGDEERIFRRGEGAGQGLGLSIARALTEADGGRLVLISRKPTTFSLVAIAPTDPVLVAAHGQPLPRWS
jgi:signal transduction histidine kinase